jgi:hypothetical protein
MDTGTGIFGRSRNLMLEHLDTSDIPDAVYEAVTGFKKNGEVAPPPAQRYKLADFRAYATKPLDKTLVSMFEDKDTRKQGMSNLVTGKLPKNFYLLLLGIKLEVLRTATGAEAEVLAGDFKTLVNNPDFAFVKNGESSLKTNRSAITFLEMPNNAYARAASGQLEEGVFYLDNNRIMQPETRIDLEIDLAAASPHPTRDFLRATLIGTALIPA